MHALSLNPKPPPMDLSALRELFGDEDDIVREILEAYADDLGRNMQEAQDATSAQDRKRLARVAHSLKGASANVGATAFAQVCGDAERRSATASWAELEDATRELTAYAARVRHWVQDQITRL